MKDLKWTSGTGRCRSDLLRTAGTETMDSDSLFTSLSNDVAVEVICFDSLIVVLKNSK